MEELSVSGNAPASLRHLYWPTGGRVFSSPQNLSSVLSTLGPQLASITLGPAHSYVLSSTYDFSSMQLLETLDMETQVVDSLVMSGLSALPNLKRFRLIVGDPIGLDTFPALQEATFLREESAYIAVTESWKYWKVPPTLVSLFIEFPSFNIYYGEYVTFAFDPNSIVPTSLKRLDVRFWSPYNLTELVLPPALEKFTMDGATTMYPFYWEQPLPTSLRHLELSAVSNWILPHSPSDCINLETLEFPSGGPYDQDPEVQSIPPLAKLTKLKTFKLSAGYQAPGIIESWLCDSLSNTLAGDPTDYGLRLETFEVSAGGSGDPFLQVFNRTCFATLGSYSNITTFRLNIANYEERLNITHSLPGGPSIREIVLRNGRGLAIDSWESVMLKWPNLRVLDFGGVLFNADPQDPAEFPGQEIVDVLDSSPLVCGRSGAPLDCINWSDTLGTFKMNLTSLTGTIPATFFEGLPNLANLSLADTQVNGSFPISNLYNVEYVDISYTYIDSFPLDIEWTNKRQQNQIRFLKLKTLNMDNTAITQWPTDDAFMSMNNLKYVSFRSTLGSSRTRVPQFWAVHPTLEHFDAASSNFEGTIPNLITSPNLKAIPLGDSGACGALPELYTRLDLDFVDMSYAGFRGTIPSSWSQFLAAKISLDLSHSFLEGDIPDNFIALPRATCVPYSPWGREIRQIILLSI